MKGFVNLPALLPARSQILTVVEVARKARKVRTLRSAAAPQAQKRPDHRHPHEFTAPRKFVAACYANTWESRTRTIGRQVDVKV